MTGSSPNAPGQMLRQRKAVTKRPRMSRIGLVIVAGSLVMMAAAIVAPTGGGTAKAHEAPVHLAPRPPMGWSNWDAFSPETVTEQQIREITDRIVSSGMKDAGYEYVIVGAGWQAASRAENGEMQADPTKFPSGMKALADYVHGKGLKFGIQQAPGTRNCRAWPVPGTATAPGATYAEQAQVDANTFASWEIDFIRLDGCGYQNLRPEDTTPLEWAQHIYGTWRQALDATGRGIVFWGHPGQYDFSHEWASVGMDLWRIKGDLRPCWEIVLAGIDANAPLAELAGPPGHWNDPDFLVLGTPRDEWPNLECFKGGLTDIEGRAHFSLWAIMAAPLVASTDLRRDSATTFETLTNREVIAVDQDSLGIQGSRIREGDHEVWVKPLSNGDSAVVLFNRSETAAKISTTAAEIGIGQTSGGYFVRDLWAHRSQFSRGTIAATVPAHGAAMFRVCTNPPGGCR